MAFKKFIAGRKFKFYYDASGVGGSSWTPCGNVEVVEENPGKKTATTDNRDREFEGEVQTAKTFGGTLRVTYDPTSVDIDAFESAYHSGDPMGIAIMDGDIATAGSKGWQADVLVKTCPRTQDLDNLSSISFEFANHGLASEDPDLVEISS